jgi:glycosyltransferase involved in cell wall biosynthesis
VTALTVEPLVSVVIAAYNAGNFLDASVASAISQSAHNLEVIVVNDGSTDDTSDRLTAWRDPRLRVIHQSNQGYASALNTGIRASRGVYVGILDADDVWLPNKLTQHIRLHREQPGTDVTFSWVNVIDKSGKPMQMPCPRWRGTVSFPELLADNMIRTSSAVVMRRAAAEEAGMFDSRFVRCIDFEFFLRVSLLRPNNIRAVPEVLTLYRRHGLQRTRQWQRMQEGWNQVLDSVRSRAPEQTASVERLACSNMYRYFAALAYEDGSFRDALRLVRRSFTLSPAQFLRDRRNWTMSAAAVAGIALPKRALLAAERAAGFDRTPAAEDSHKTTF